MNLQEVIDIAKNSELNTLAVRNDDTAIVGFINLGLIELYSIFALRTEEYVINLQDNVTIYNLPSDFMYMTAAYGEVPAGSSEESAALPINEENNPFSVNTISFSQVQVPLSSAGKYVSIMYVPKPVKMSAGDLAAEVPVPDQLIQPLLAFIGYKGHGAIRTDGQGEADIYYLRFKRICDEIRKLGVGIAADDLNMAGRISDRGFV